MDEAGGDAELPSRLAALTARFQEISDTVMRDLPVSNPALAVEAVGFRAVADGWLGALVTPWFINLVLLPADPAVWAVCPAGHRVVRPVPAGDRMFAIEQIEGLDPFLMSGVHSPLPQFATQDQARAAAEQALAAALTPPAAPAPAPAPQPEAPKSVDRRALFRGLLGRG